ncbi:hypothetical protein ALP71_00796, partial [Pseudomonas coronafaciens pv. garcae]
AHRLANFTGSMLRHHHHKSTKYMAQWIEAKNRVKDESPTQALPETPASEGQTG